MDALASAVGALTGAALPLTLPQMVHALSGVEGCDGEELGEEVGYADAILVDGAVAWHYLIEYCKHLGGVDVVTLDQCIEILTDRAWIDEPDTFIFECRNPKCSEEHELAVGTREKTCECGWRYYFDRNGVLEKMDFYCHCGALNEQVGADDIQSCPDCDCDWRLSDGFVQNYDEITKPLSFTCHCGMKHGYLRCETDMITCICGCEYELEGGGAVNHCYQCEEDEGEI